MIQRPSVNILCDWLTLHLVCALALVYMRQTTHVSAKAEYISVYSFCSGGSSELLMTKVNPHL